MTEEVDHVPVGERAEHAGLGGECRLLGVGEEVAGIGYLLDEHGGLACDVGLTGIAQVGPGIVVVPGVLEDGVVAGVVPFVHDDDSVGAEFLKVPVAAHEHAVAAFGAGIGYVALVEERAVEAAQVAVPLCRGGDVKLGLGVVGGDVEVAGAGSGGKTQAQAGYGCIFI